VTASNVALVTGAGSGTGAAATARFRRMGIPVVGMGRRPDPSILPAGDQAAPFTWVQGDQADSEAWARAVDLARTEYGMSPSILVVSGARLEVGTVLTLPEEVWMETFQTNVFGLVRGLKAVLPGMIERGKGSIVTVGSIDSLFAEQGLVSYAASKGAILQITRNVAMDHARQGIRANCVIMGVTDTPFFRRHLNTAADPEQFVKVRENRQPMGRLLEADQIAAMIAFLALDDASGVTGAAIPVDGGITTSFDFRTGEEGG
jgi:NAD(P)-dependent dehydrogenase (short-subunit alcohol dehydrogenase family)